MMRKSVWLLSAGLFALSVPAYAQETDTDAGGAQPTDGATAEAAAVDNQATETSAQGDTSEIVVTATRRNEALSDVPLAVSAVTAETLENSGASDIRQLQQVSPSLMVSSTSSESGGGVARIRGIGTVGDNPGNGRNDQSRNRRGKTNKSERQFRAANLVNQPTLSDNLHPGAGQRNQLPAQKEAIVAMA